MSPRLILLLIALLAAPASATARTVCPVGNWVNAGYQDGINGQPVHWISRYRKACELNGSAVDHETYLAARNRGLERYCRAYNGFELGARGTPYYGACPSPLEDDFLNAYRAGARVHGLNRQIQGVDRQITWYEERLIELTETPRHDAAYIAEQTARLRVEIDRLEQLRAAYREQLEEYKTRIASIS